MNKLLSGVWSNAYGSQMTIVAQGTSFHGTYSSHTGSTGEYLIVGNSSAADPTQELGQSIALSIYWKSVNGGTKDNSWHWTGSMCGELQYDGKMTLINSIVASVPLDTYEKGNYVDKLVFTKTQDTVAADITDIRRNVETANLDVYPIAGRWVGLEDKIELNIYKVAHDSGFSNAILTLSDKEIPLTGFIDTDAEVDMAQSVSLTGSQAESNEVYSISGMLNYNSEYLTLSWWTGRVTTPQDNFMQAKMIGITLKKAG